MDCIRKFYPCSYSGNPKLFQSKSLEKRNEKQSVTLTVSFTVACPWTDPAVPFLAPSSGHPSIPMVGSSPLGSGIPDFPAPSSASRHTLQTLSPPLHAGKECLHARPLDFSHSADQPSGLHIPDTPHCSHCRPSSHPLPSAAGSHGLAFLLPPTLPTQLLLQGPRSSLVPVFMAVTVPLADMFSASPLPRPQAPWKQGCAYSPHPHSTPTSLESSEELLVHHGRQECRE